MKIVPNVCEFALHSLQENIAVELKDLMERLYTIEKGAIEYSKIRISTALKDNEVSDHDFKIESMNFNLDD